MINGEISRILTEMGDFLELAQDNPFRIRAYRNAAEILYHHPADLKTLSPKEQLEIQGVGKGISDLIEEYKKSGRVQEYERLRKKFPPGLLDVMNLPGLGAKRTAFLYAELKISSVLELKAAIDKGQLEKLPGFGEKMKQNILDNMAWAAETGHRMLISQARELADEIKTYLAQSPVIKKLELAGSARRWKETVGDLDFLCTSNQPEKAMDHFLAFPRSMRVLAQGKTKSSLVLRGGMQCDFRVVEDQSFGAALLYFTGSKEHNVKLREMAQKKGMTLNEYGLYKLSDKKKAKPVAGKTEEEMYRAFGLPWIPPELREDRGEIEAGLANKLPRLVTVDDITGDFHNHTSLTDGNNTLEEMVTAARERKWQWFYSGDHSPSLTVASGLTVDQLRKKMAAVKELSKRFKDFPLYTSSEVDILGDGKMDYSDPVLKELGCVVASVHSRFKQPQKEMTERICRALENPYVDILGHISGRLINKRKGYEIDIETILQKAKATTSAIEVNGQPDRLELNDVHVKRAVELGVPLAISTDAHSIQELNNVTLAIQVARRGWAEPRHVINTFSHADIVKWLGR